MSQGTISHFIMHGPQQPRLAAEVNLDSSAGSESDSSSDEPSAKRRRGRKVENPIWDYFTRKKNPTKISVCQVQSSNGISCEHTINGWYATNAIHHLRGKHTKKFREFEAKLESKNAEKQRSRATEEKMRQTKLDEPLRRKGTKYEPSNPKQKRFDTKLAIMFASSNIPLNLIEKVKFYFNFII